MYRDDIKKHSKDRSMIMRIERDGQREIWHRATASLPKGAYRVIFEVEFDVQEQGTFPVESFGIDSIKVESGLCTLEGEFKHMGIYVIKKHNLLFRFFTLRFLTDFIHKYLWF